jgi:signal recognition particle receptor subunit beta
MSNFRGSAGYILVVDGCRAQTWKTAIDLRQRIIDQFGALPFVLALNKADLADQWEVDRSEIASQGWTTFETSAKSGANVEEIFLELSRKMIAEGPDE